MSDRVPPEDLAKMREALQSPDAHIRLVQTFTHGRGAQVMVKTRKIGPIIFPGEDMTLAEVMHMLGKMAEEGES